MDQGSKNNKVTKRVVAAINVNDDKLTPQRTVKKALTSLNSVSKPFTLPHDVNEISLTGAGDPQQHF